jgi:hypothetical protein
MTRAEHMFPEMRERRARTLRVDDDLFFHSARYVFSGGVEVKKLHQIAGSWRF